MTLPPKATSVSEDGQPDGYTPPASWAAEVIPGGYTRLVVSVPSGQLEAVHQALVDALTVPYRVLYMQLVDRSRGIQLDPPRQFVGLEIEPATLSLALSTHRALVYHDGRHQLWVQGKGEDKIVMEETGVLYVYPDDPLFREVLVAQGISESTVEPMSERDYVRVDYIAEADPEEASLHRALGLVRYGD